MSSIESGLIIGLICVTFIVSIILLIVYLLCGLFSQKQKKPIQSPVQKTNNMTKNSQFFLAANINSTVVAFYDNQKLILETNNPEVFFSRYQLALKQLTALAETKKYGINLGNLDPDEIFQYLINKKSEIIDNFIIRSYNHAQNKAAELKTETGKRNRIEKYFTSLEPFKSQMFPQNIQRIEDLRNNLPKDISPIGISVEIRTESTYPHYPKEDQIEDLADGYIHTGNTVQRLDGKQITDADAAYLIKSTMDAALSTPSRRTEQEEELSFRFEQSKMAEKSEKLCKEFEDLEYEARKTDDLESKIKILQQALLSFNKAKEWHYKYSKGSKIYFQDTYEYWHNSKNSCFGWEDEIKDLIEYLEDKIEEEKRMHDLVIPWILENAENGFLQTKIYKVFPDENKAELRKLIKELADENKINTEKKGSSYYITSNRKTDEQP